VEEVLVAEALEALVAEASAVAVQVVLGNVELNYLRSMNLKLRTSLAGALLVLFMGVLSFQTFHQLTEHSHDSISEHEHEDEQCQFCAVKALPYLPVEILDIAFHCNGVPPSMITDNSNKQILGEFKPKQSETD
jgi:hypothetical protein